MTLYPNSAALLIAGLVRTALAGSKLALYTAIAAPVSPATVLADLTEATFSGYAQATITNFLLPYLDPEGGATIQSGTQQFNYVEPMSAPVHETCLGFYLLKSTGELIAVGTFDAPIPMAANGDAIPVNVALNFGRS